MSNYKHKYNKYKCKYTNQKEKCTQLSINGGVNNFLNNKKAILNMTDGTYMFKDDTKFLFYPKIDSIYPKVCSKFQLNNKIYNIKFIQNQCYNFLFIFETTDITDENQHILLKDGPYRGTILKSLLPDNNGSWKFGFSKDIKVFKCNFNTDTFTICNYLEDYQYYAIHQYLRYNEYGFKNYTIKIYADDNKVYNETKKHNVTIYKATCFLYDRVLDAERDAGLLYYNDPSKFVYIMMFVNNDIYIISHINYTKIMETSRGVFSKWSADPVNI